MTGDAIQTAIVYAESEWGKEISEPATEELKAVLAVVDAVRAFVEHRDYEPGHTMLENKLWVALAALDGVKP